MEDKNLDKYSTLKPYGKESFNAATRLQRNNFEKDTLKKLHSLFSNALTEKSRLYRDSQTHPTG